MQDALREALALARVATFEFSIGDGMLRRDNPLTHTVAGPNSDTQLSELFELLHPDDRNRVRQAVLGLEDGGGSVHLTCRAVAGDGLVREFQLSAVADLPAGSIHGVVLDITDESEARRSAQESELLLAGLIDSIPASVIVFDEHLVIQRVNLELTTSLGVDAADFVGKSMFEAIPLGNGSEFEVHYRKAVRTGLPVHFEFLFTPFQEWYEVSVEPLASGFISYTRSANDRKELEELVREQEQQLLQSEKMRVVGQLAAGIAHDFNNQLAAVLGYADLLRSQLEDDRLHSYADRIVAAADRASALSKRVLSFGEDAGARHEAFDVSQIVAEVVELLSLTAPCSIVCVGEAEGETNVQGDASQVQGALLNLVLNARDAVGADGSVVISTEAINLDEPVVGHSGLAIAPGPAVKVSVTDSGPGMSAAVRDRAFEQFFSTRGDGRGLGLANVYAVAKQHSGTVTLVSSAEGGTTADLYLPCNQDLEQSEPTPPDVQTEATDAAVMSTTVLVVEDNELVGGLALEGLTALGLDTIRARNGEEAMVAFLRHGESIGLVYLDWVLPGMPGAEVLRQLKALRPDLPVVIASGLMSAKVSSDDTPADGFLGKPFTLDQLRAAIVQAQRA